MPHEGIFPTFFLSGFECSTFRWHDVGRRDLVAETRHREHADEDYRFLADLGIGVAREGVPWPFVDDGGSFDFSLIEPVSKAMSRYGIVPIWDLFHYGYPDDVDPFGEGFVPRFTRYCASVAEHLVSAGAGPPLFTPVNEITFFAAAGAAWGWAAPFARDRAARDEFRLVLCAAAIEGCRAILDVEPAARFVHIDPIVNVVAPVDRPDLEEAARHETYDDTFLAWDVIAGRRHPELGGSPELLDIVGVNVYSFGQMEYRGLGPHSPLEPGDPRIRPLADMLGDVWARYRRPMVIGETSGLRDGRTEWLRDVMHESLAAIDAGVELHGVCLFPGVDMPDWHTGEWLHSGIVDLVEEDGDLRREADEGYVAELRRWQTLLQRPTTLDAGSTTDPVDLDDVRAAAHGFASERDADWH